MDRVVLPHSGHPRLTYFLAAEEWVARHLPSGDYFFAWQVDSTVICGRNQCIEAEVDLQYCRDNGIDVVRRRSGGGCVYSDMGNVMLSLITATESVDEAFSLFTSKITEALRKLGIPAEVTGRNDITVRGRKVSGGAIYGLHGRTIVHGTMLVSTDIAGHMTLAITPSAAKLSSSGVKSVESRVTTLQREGLTMNPADLAEYMCSSLCSDSIELDADADAQIRQIEMPYRETAFLNGRQRLVQQASSHSAHFDGIGELTLAYTVDHRGLIDKAILTGDYMAPDADIDQLLNRLHGVEANNEAVLAALSDLSTDSIISGLRPQHIASLVGDQSQ